MKKLSLFVLLSTFSFATFAIDTKLTIKGTGIDGSACEAIIVQSEDATLKSVELKGATETFEIIAEKQDGYGPRKDISPRGADTIFEMFQEDPKLYAKMSYDWKSLSGKEVYSLSTKQLFDGKKPDDIKFLNGTYKIEISYDEEGTAYFIEAESKFKAGHFLTIGRQTFTCQL